MPVTLLSYYLCLFCFIVVKCSDANFNPASRAVPSSPAPNPYMILVNNAINSNSNPRNADIKANTRSNSSIRMSRRGRRRTFPSNPSSASNTGSASSGRSSSSTNPSGSHTLASSTTPSSSLSQRQIPVLSIQPPPLEWTQNWVELDNGNTGVTYYIPNSSRSINPTWKQVRLWNPNTLIGKLLANQCNNDIFHDILDGSFESSKLDIFEAAIASCQDQYSTSNEKFQTLTKKIMSSVRADNHRFLNALLAKNCNGEFSKYILGQIHVVENFRILKSIFESCGQSFPSFANNVWKRESSSKAKTINNEKLDISHHIPYGYDQYLDEIILNSKRWPSKLTESGWINIAAAYENTGQARVIWGESGRLKNAPYLHYNFHADCITVLLNGNVKKDIRLQNIIKKYKDMKTIIDKAKEELTYFKRTHDTRGAVIYWNKSTKEAGIVMTKDVHVAIYRDGDPIHLSNNWKHSGSATNKKSKKIVTHHMSGLAPGDIIMVTPREVQEFTKEWDQRAISFTVELEDFPSYFLDYMSTVYAKNRKRLSMMAAMITEQS